jgi:hypothetical protein
VSQHSTRLFPIDPSSSRGASGVLCVRARVPESLCLCVPCVPALRFMHLSPETRAACAIGELKTLIQVSHGARTRITCYRLREHNPMFCMAADGITVAWRLHALSCVSACVRAFRRCMPRSWRTRAFSLALATAT